MLTVTDDKHSFKLDYEESIDLELKLNVSGLGKRWSHIGDVLFDYGTKKKGLHAELLVDADEYAFLLRLMEKASWEQCRGMY